MLYFPQKGPHMMSPARMISQCLLFAGLSAAGLLVPGRVAAKTNVIFVLTDDQGHWALNAKGDDDCRSLVTPNLARLAQEGMRFSNAFVCSPVCSASRATWLTGRIPSKTGVQDYLRFEETHGERAKHSRTTATPLACAANGISEMTPGHRLASLIGRRGHLTEHIVILRFGKTERDISGTAIGRT